MLNPFPIQFLALLAYLILRVVIGAALLYFGIRHGRQREAFAQGLGLPHTQTGIFFVVLIALFECVVGLMFILGYYTQIAALATLLMSATLITLRKQFTTPLLESRMFYVLLGGAALSLFITGAGALAFDLPI